MPFVKLFKIDQDKNYLNKSGYLLLNYLIVKLLKKYLLKYLNVKNIL